MNVAMVVGTLSRNGGTERSAWELSRWLVQRGHEVHVYCRAAEAAAPGVRVHLGSLRVPEGRHPVVHAFVRIPGATVFRAGGGAHLAWLHARWRGLGAVRRWTPRARWEVRRDRRCMRTARVVVCNSDMAAADVRRLYGVDRIVVVWNGVDLDRFRPDAERRAAARRAWEATGRVALFLGHGFRRKGLAVAAEAFARVAAPDDRLVVIGADAHARRYLAGLDPRVRCQGPVPDPEQWLPGADATLLPTLYDSAANTTLEAMACGVPAITSGRDGNAARVPDRRLVVDDPRDVEGFARALDLAWREPALGRGCRKAAERWPVSRNGQEVESIYRELM